MFFNDTSEIVSIAARTGCAIFVVPEGTKVEIKNAFLLEPTNKSVITIEQVRDVLGVLSVRQVGDVFVVVRPADKLGDEAANALLKNLEEPKEKVHFVLITDKPSLILPTILSRAEIYFLKVPVDVDGPIEAVPRETLLAKRILVAKPADLVPLAEELAKTKDRAYVLSVLAVAIEMARKSYFKTGKIAFLNKIPKMLDAYENISKNGHIKLHLVADLC